MQYSFYLKAGTLLIMGLISSLVQAQDHAQNKTEFGLEQDFLPYATGGYYFGAWAGKSHLRGRFLTAQHVTKPSVIVPSGFTNNTVNAYALVCDYFLKTGWKGWWISGGLVLWNSSIQSDLKINTAHYDNILLNGSIGYSWKFGDHFYVSPWAGLHIRVGGAQTVNVDGSSFTTPVLNPEASLKIGWIF